MNPATQKALRHRRLNVLAIVSLVVIAYLSLGFVANVGPELGYRLRQPRGPAPTVGVDPYPEEAFRTMDQSWRAVVDGLHGSSPANIGSAVFLVDLGCDHGLVVDALARLHHRTVQSMLGDEELVARLQPMQVAEAVPETHLAALDDEKPVSVVDMRGRAFLPGLDEGVQFNGDVVPDDCRLEPFRLLPACL